MSDEKDLRIDAPKDVAGGVPAVVAAMKTSLAQMGPVRAARALFRVNQKEGFDCPGCAWPDPDDRRSMVEFCENGAKAVAEEATKRRIGAAFFREWSVEKLAAQSDHWLGQQGRLTEPMRLRAGASHYEPVSWDEAFSSIGGALRALSSPNRAVFYTSGRTSNEAAFLYQLFVRLYGTNNLPDCSNMCHESSGYGLMETIGSGKGTVLLEDFDHADCIFVIGQNPGTNHPRMLSTLQGAARRGCEIIAVNPLPEAGLLAFRHPQEIGGVLGPATKLATRFVPVRINGDVALLKGIMKAMLERPGVVDRAFVEKHTLGFDAFAADLAAERWDAIVESSGIDEKTIRELAAIAARAERTIVCWAMGITQHRNGVANVQEIVNLLLLRGNFGRPGAGACPVRGHSNVQGDRSMGIYEKPAPWFLDALERELHFAPPRDDGFDTVEAIRAMHDGRAEIFLAMGGNFLSAAPDTAHTAEALRRCRLTAHVSTKLNRSHLTTGKEAYILPCLARSEQDGGQFVTVENSMGIVHSSHGRLAPASKALLSEPAIVARLAKATLRETTANRNAVDWDALVANYDRIRDLIARVVPGFEDFNGRVRRPGGFALAHPVRDAREFRTASGKAHFTVHAIPIHDIGERRYLMATVRTHDQYNTTIYGLDDRYRGIRQGRRVVLMNAEDIAAEKLAAGALVDIVSHFRGTERRAPRFVVVSYPIPRGCVATYFPEANVLVALDDFADGSRTPASKSVVVSLEHVR